MRSSSEKATILVAADPFAVGLKKAIVAHLEKRGFEVKDYGATDANKEKPYFESAVDVCRAELPLRPDEAPVESGVQQEDEEDDLHDGVRPGDRRLALMKDEVFHQALRETVLSY